MSSNDVAVRVEGVSKRFELYNAPRDRLKQFLLPRLQKAAGRESKSYFQEFWALRDVSFDIRRGESVGILGRNGSGKSTLLQIITGTLSPTTGSVETNGRIAALLELGSGFNPDFSGRENIYLNGALLGFTREQMDQKFDAIAAFADIGVHLEQPIKSYSSGMLIRLAFAVQVQIDPDILIVDEALAVGDALFQKRCFQRINRLVSAGTTLLFVSHDQESVRTLTNRALLLNKGNAISWGASSEVILEYRRLLHAEESLSLAASVQDLAARAQEQPSISNDVKASPSELCESAAVSPETSSDADRLSFGDGWVKIRKVETLDGAGNPAMVFFPGDPLRIKITCHASTALDRLNIAIRLRNKEGVKIYSWGTLNQDISIKADNLGGALFWSREIAAGEQFDVFFDCECNLGANLYEVQASVSFEETPDYSSQTMLHWIDEAAFFQVMTKKDEYFFGGVVDLKMKAEW